MGSYYTITFDQLDGRTLPQGDRIEVAVADGPDPNKITIALISQVSWWKGIQANEIVLCQTQDSQNTSQADVDIARVHEKGIQLWKARGAGIHYNQYDVTNIRSWAQGGKYTLLFGRMTNPDKRGRYNEEIYNVFRQQQTRLCIIVR
jgi:hypothetical protein